MTREIDPFPQVMTPDEVAALLRRSVNTLRHWRSRGEGPPAFRSGRRTFYLRSDVLSWLADQRRDGGDGR